MQQTNLLNILPLRKYPLFWFGTWLVAIFAFILWNSSRLESVLGPPAVGDFKRFWAAGHVLAAGGNPYDLQLLSKYSEAQGAGLIEPLPFYYPFFSFTALLPFSLFPFQPARFFYLATLLIMYSSGWLLRPARGFLAILRLGKITLPSIIELSILLTFLPFLILWWDGGITIFPFFGVFLFLFFEENKKGSLEGWRWAFLQGLSLSILLVKPSMCFLVLIFLTVAWFRRGDLVRLLGFAAGFLLLVIPSALLMPSLQSILSTGQGGPNLLLWNNPTASAFIQSSLHLPPETRLIFVLLAGAFSFLRALKIRSGDNLSDEIRRTMIPLSLVTVPYAWTYDFVLLLFSITLIFRNSINPKEYRDAEVDYRTLLLLLAFNLALAALPLAMELHWWYPVMVLLLCLRKSPLGESKPS